MFRLHSVLLIALDVVKGPYIHCFAPVNPFEREDADRFSDIFVPRPEFCHRVVSLLEAESGLFYLFYPEEIAGVQYIRNSLRYTLCFVFCVDQGVVTIGAGETERLVGPYRVTLNSIVEELRDTELRYGYMSRALAGRRATESSATPFHQGINPPSRTEVSCVLSPVTPSPAAAVAAPTATTITTTTITETTTQRAATTAPAMPWTGTDDGKSSGRPWRVNVFLTPIHDPAACEWTPLEGVIETIYSDLSGGGEDEEKLENDPSKQPLQLFQHEQLQQKQQKQFSEVVRIVSVRLSASASFQVRCLPSPQVPPPHMLDDLPIPITSYAPETMEWADMAVQDVFRAVDGRRTIAEIVHILAAGHEPLEERAVSRAGANSGVDYRRFPFFSPPLHSHREMTVMTTTTTTTPPFPPTQSIGATTAFVSSPWSRATVEGGTLSRSATAMLLSPGCPQSPLLSSPQLLQQQQLLLQQQQQQQQQQQSTQTTSHQIVSPLSLGAHSGSMVWPKAPNPSRAADAETEGRMCELEWTVLEALQHLEANHYVRIVRPCRLHSTYSATRALYGLLSDRQHPTRRMLGEWLLRLAIVARQKRQHERRSKTPFTCDPNHRMGGASGGRAETVTLPAVLLTTAALERQARAERRRHRLETVQMFSSSSSAASSSSDGDAVDLGGTSESNKAVGERRFSETAISAAASAALCALGKFTNNRIANVRREMRRVPVWRHAFDGWREECCKALVEVALLNGWLVEIPSAAQPTD